MEPILNTRRGFDTGRNGSFASNRGIGRKDKPTHDSFIASPMAEGLGHPLQYGVDRLLNLLIRKGA